MDGMLLILKLNRSYFFLFSSSIPASHSCFTFLHILIRKILAWARRRQFLAVLETRLPHKVTRLVLFSLSDVSFVVARWWVIVGRLELTLRLAE